MSGVRDRARAVATAGRTSLWPVPVAGVVLALAGGVVLPRLDRAVDDDLPGWVTGLLFSGGPGAARTVLDAVASSLITVTSLTFSLTVVTLQLASSQFSPRLLRTFTRDRFVHVTLAIFLATFTYALTVERTVRSADESGGGAEGGAGGGAGGGAFVPQLSVTAAFLLTIASVVALVLFLAHLAGEIRVETMLETVHQDAAATARAVLGGPRPRGAVPDALTDDTTTRLRPPAGAIPLVARSSGFLVRVEEDQLLSAAVDAGALVVLEVLPGASVVAGTPVGWAWSPAGAPLDAEACATLEEAVDEAVVIGPERTEAQDVAYGLRQLTDVATKALSPGINDPTTAVHALGHSSALLCELAPLGLGPKGLHEHGRDHGRNHDHRHDGGRGAKDGDARDDRDDHDDEGDREGERGRLRVVLARPSLADLLDLAVTQPRRYGAADPTVLAALYVLLRALAWTAPDVAGGAVRAQLERLDATAQASAEAGDHDATEAASLRALSGEVGDAVSGVWRPRGVHATASLSGPAAAGAQR